MSTNPHVGHQHRMRGYSVQNNRTQNCGPIDRSAPSSAVQFNNPAFEFRSGQPSNPEGFVSPSTYDLSQNAHLVGQSFYAQDANFQSSDWDDLNSYFTSVDQHPWNHVAAGSTFSTNVQPADITEIPGGQCSKAWTDPNGTELRRTFSQSRHSAASISRDSGFESAGQPSRVNASHNSTSPLRLMKPHVSASFSNQLAPVDVGRRTSSVKSQKSVDASGEGLKLKRPRTEILRCSICPNKELKNQSDAQKHAAQHNKPHRCLEPSCQRPDGFGTLNDLQRHRKSVHGLSPTVGKPTGFICHACPEPGGDAQKKWWPRRDNYKAHVGRKHPNWNLEALLDLSERSRPDNVDEARTESGYGSQPQFSHYGDEQPYDVDLRSPLEQTMSRHASYQGDVGASEFEQHYADVTAGAGHGLSMEYYPDGSVGAEGDLNSFDLSSMALGTQHLAVHRGSSLMPTMPLAHSTDGNMLDAYGFPQSGHAQQDWDQHSRRQRTSSAPQLIKDVHFDLTDHNQYKCLTCNKIKKRECDFRKHYKRHTRPYGCTYTNCSKPFGSRNDWKRHENSQHSLIEMWRCELLGPNGMKCAQLCYQRGDFVSHLEHKHSLPQGSQENEYHCNAMHLSRDAHDHFWCGFCNKLISNPDDIQTAAYERRFSHIGDHFDKDNDHIDNWIDVEENKPKRELKHDKDLKAQLRMDNDDSDLGDDGIPPLSTTVHHSRSRHDAVNAAQADWDSLHKRKMPDAEIDAEGVSDDE